MLKAEEGFVCAEGGGVSGDVLLWKRGQEGSIPSVDTVVDPICVGELEGGGEGWVGCC